MVVNYWIFQNCHHRAVKEPINRLSLPWWLLVTIDRLIDSCPNIILWNCWQAVGSRGSDVIFWHKKRMKKSIFFPICPSVSDSWLKIIEDWDLNRLGVFFHSDSKVGLQNVKQLTSSNVYFIWSKSCEIKNKDTVLTWPVFFIHYESKLLP